MIKIRKDRVVLLGLSHANLDRLRADGLDGFIRIAGEELGIDITILITAGETEQAMLEHFASSVGPDTKVTIDPRFKS